MKTANWWDDQTNLRVLADYLIREGFLKSPEDAVQLFTEPHTYNRQWHQFQRELTRRIMTERPKSLEFFDDRWYHIGEKWLPSVTSILWAYPSPHLVQLIGVVGAENMEVRKQIAAERGSRVHDALSKNAEVDRKDFDDNEWLYLMRAKLFFDEYKPQLVMNEEVVWSEEHGYAGRVDRVVTMSGKMVLLDFKTGYVGREAWLQLAALRRALDETYGILVESWGIVELNSRGKQGWAYRPIEERSDVEKLIKVDAMTVQDAIEFAYELDLEVFDALHVVWRDTFSSVKPKTFPFPPPDVLDLTIPVYIPKQQEEEPEQRGQQNVESANIESEQVVLEPTEEKGEKSKARKSRKRKEE